MERLCDICNKFREWSLWTGQPTQETFRDAKFPHYSKGSELKESAKNRCHLCMLFNEALQRSLRPEGELELPDRHVYIAVELPSMIRPWFSLKITIEPASISTAGKHSIDIVPDYPCFFSLPCDDLEEGRKVGEDLVDNGDFLQTPVWMLKPTKSEGKAAYFFGKDEISEDEFYAIAMPYHVGFVDLNWVNYDSHQILTICRNESDSNTNSEVARILGAYWETACKLAHPYCSAATEESQMPLLPSRVLYIENKWNLESSEIGRPVPLQVRLLQNPPGKRAEYFVLSHCWGKHPVIRTLTKNIESYQRNIPWADFPQTFQDALTITMRIKHQYLWIDALCIIQDSKEDWEAESAKMGSIYRNSKLCISALASEDSTGGCFRERDGLLNRPCGLWPKSPRALQFPAVDFERAVYAFSRRAERDLGPLSKRAWVLQEEFLSPRRFIFGEDSVAWKCLTTYMTEGDPGRLYGQPNIMRDGNFDAVQIFQSAIGKILNMDSEEETMRVYQSWLLMVEAYSRRQLTKGSDRLAALAGIATFFARATKDQYLAGIWKRYLWRDLIWHALSLGSPRFGRRLASWERLNKHGLAEDFSAPSWSWTSLNAEIVYFPRMELDSYAEHEVLVSVLSTECEPSHPDAISSSFVGALRLKGEAAIGLANQLDFNSKDYAELGQKFRDKSFAAMNKRSEEENAARKKLENFLGNASASESLVLKTSEASTSTSGTKPPVSDLGGAESDKIEKLPSFIEYQASLDRTSLNTQQLLDQGYGQLPDVTRTIIGGSDYWENSHFWAGNSLKDMESGDQVGYWAPDFDTNSNNCFPVLVLAISRHRGYIYGLGIEAVDEEKAVYKRLGLAFWHEIPWENCKEKVDIEITLI